MLTEHRQRVIAQVATFSRKKPASRHKATELVQMVIAVFDQERDGPVGPAKLRDYDNLVKVST